MRNVKVFLLLFIFAVSCSGGKPIDETEIMWDNYGVPHIFAKDARDMYFSYGWAQMHNHADLILKLYGQARGRAAEYWGEEYLVSDQKVRLFMVPEQAKKIYENQNAEFKSYLDAFAEGINKYALEHPEAIDEEMQQVLPVNVYDVVGHTVRVTSLEFLAGEDIAIAYQLSQAGSNAIAIAPSKSASGNSMLVINPHLPWSDFFLWFEAHLICDGFNAYGVSLVGMPSITMAFNENLGWAHTINPIDASDRYKLTLKDGGYVLDGEVVLFEKNPVNIKIRQADGSLRVQKFEFSYSKHGPVVNQNEANAYAVRIAGFDNFRIFEQYHKMAQATDFEEFELAVKMLQNPMFNIIYADKDGNIFYFFNGNIPKRNEGDYSFWKGTIDGTRSDLIWDSIHSYNDLPKVKNPASGFVQNCNDAPWFCTDPPVLNPYDFPPYFSNKWTFMRPQRAVNMIKGNPKVTYDQLTEYKHNTELETANRFLDDLLLSLEKYPDPRAEEAAIILKAWDKKTEVKSKGAVLFTTWWNKINSKMFETPWSASNPFETPDGIKEQKKAVELLIEAADEVKQKYGKLDVEWGEVNRYRMNDLDFPANGGPGDYGIFRTIYFAPDSDNKKRAIAGETFVAVVEFGEQLKANVILSYGNSTQPGNRHVGDQLKMLSEKKLRPALIDKADILENTEEIENLSEKKFLNALNLNYKSNEKEKQIMFDLSARQSWFMYAALLAFLGLNSSPILAKGGSDLIQKHPVSGTITSSEDGSTLPGVNITLKGTMIGTISDANGEYSIVCDNPDVTLLFSYVGFLSQEIAVNKRSVIDVQMTVDTKTLEEVVIVGYGTQKKVSLTGAVDVINNEEIKDRPVANVSQALQGLAPNLNITTGSNGGEMGAKLNINIRGMGSINGGEPYVLVDGVEQDLYSLNPSDIESISVLKDASASAIYGARAAFGVILVTTKSGRTDGISVTYSNNFSFSAPTIVPHPVNSLDFAEYFNYGSRNSKVIEPFVPRVIDSIVKYQAGEIDYWTVPYPGHEQAWLSYNGSWANTDWYEETYKKWVPNSTHNLSVSGGNERTQYFISGSVFNQAGLFNYGEDSYTRNTINTKINTKVNEWLRFNFMSKIASTRIERPSYERKDFYYSLLRQWPTNAPYYPDGNLAGEAVQIWLERGGMYKANQNDILIVPGVEIEPLKDWVIYVNYRWKYNPGQATNHKATVYATDAYGLPFLLPGENYFIMGSQENTYNSPNIYSTYNKKIGENDFTIMAGFEQELSTYKTSFAKRYDLVTDDIPSLATAVGRDENGGEMGHYSTRSFFGRMNYSYKEKYLFEISGRFDGSSKFPQNYRWGMFPSGSAAYIISKEDFWNPLQSVINLFKVRVSYGSLGNQIVDNYLYVERMPFHTSMPYIMGDERPNYVQMADLVSPGITWEKVRTSDVGIDAGFFSNQLTLSADYFIRNTLDMLGPAESYPLVLGTAAPKSNNAALQTKGFEFVLEWRQRIQELSYSAKFLLSDYRTTITQYYNPQKLLNGAFYEGAKEGEIWGYTSVGLFESDEQAQDPNHDQSFLSPKTWQAGDVNYADLNNDHKIDKGMNTVDDPGDLSIIGDSTAHYRISAVINTTWKGFDFSMLWQGVAKRDLALDGPLFWGMLGSKWWNIALEQHMDYWTPDNTDAYWPRPYYENWDAVKNHQIQTRYLQNGAYLRLKSVQLGYTLPIKLSQKVKMNNLRVFVSGENLITITKLIGVFDPELTGGVYGSGAQYPLQKVISVGLNATF